MSLPAGQTLPEAELVVPRDGPIDLAWLERVCRYATDSFGKPSVNPIVAVAVESDLVAAASDYLFGTGVEVVSLLNPDRSIRYQAQKSLAAGAVDLAVPAANVDELTGLAGLGLADPTAITVDIGHDLGRGVNAAIDAVARASGAGASFISFTPELNTPAGIATCSEVLNAASDLGLHGVKVAMRPHDPIGVSLLSGSTDEPRARISIAAQHVVPGAFSRLS